MTTVIDPVGTPFPVYNRSGTTIVEIAAAGDGTVGETPRAAATPIPALSGVTIALCTVTDTDPGEFGVSLPAGAEVGDVVEVYSLNGGMIGFLQVYCATGDSINTANAVVPHAVTLATGAFRFRKVTSTDWRS